jgi:hypothetical protein
MRKTNKLMSIHFKHNLLFYCLLIKIMVNLFDNFPLFNIRDDI